jgi:hypothetical protein
VYEEEYKLSIENKRDKKVKNKVDNLELMESEYIERFKKKIKNP